MLPEQYFLRYAFPCAQVLLDLKRITQADYDKLKNAVLNNEVLSRVYLEKIFVKAVTGMRTVSEDIWDVNVIKEYFHNKHDEMISKDLPPTIQKLCKVKEGILVAKNEPAFIAKLGSEKRNVFALYEKPKIGDRVIIHYWYAVERIS